MFRPLRRLLLFHVKYSRYAQVTQLAIATGAKTFSFRGSVGRRKDTISTGVITSTGTAPQTLVYHHLPGLRPTSHGRLILTGRDLSSLFLRMRWEEFRCAALGWVFRPAPTRLNFFVIYLEVAKYYTGVEDDGSSLWGKDAGVWEQVARLHDVLQRNVRLRSPGEDNAEFPARSNLTVLRSRTARSTKSDAESMPPPTTSTSTLAGLPPDDLLFTLVSRQVKCMYVLRPGETTFHGADFTSF